ncbi:MAG: CBS domain-containing protein, partial [Halobacteriaceae archaeon]
GRILRALLARSRSYGSATRIAARIGVVFAFLFAIVGILNFQIILILLAFFIYAAATTESRTVLIDELLEGITVGDIMQNNPVHVSADSSLDDFGKQMLQDRQSVHLVVDENENPIGIITLKDIKAARGKDRESTTVRDVMQEVPVVEATADAFDTLSMLNQSGKSNALVEKDGAFVGIITQSDFSEAVTIQRGFQSRVPM